jgi:D-beta-D-heptose 7-phosphate kinase/D-beta-D-heptose 1-phosphate adenosyltransferase
MIDIQKVQEILSKAKGKQILSCGDVMLDGYMTGTVDRFSQEAPVPVIAVQSEVFFPGGAGNAAACMSEIGINPHLIAVVGVNGRIDYSEILKEECEKNRINPVFVIDPRRKTTLKLRLAAIKTTKQHVARVDIEDNFDLSSEIQDQTIDKIKETFEKINPSAISIHDYKKGFLTEKIFRTLMEISKENKLPVFADLKQDTFIKFKNLIAAPQMFYLKPNRLESAETAKLLSSYDFNKDGSNDEEIIEIAEIIQKEIPIHIIITRGRKGAVFFEYGQKPFFVRPEETEEQFDVAGAGDTVEAFLIASYLGGATMPEALEISVASSQVAIRKFGTSIVTENELLSWIKMHEQRRK